MSPAWSFEPSSNDITGGSKENKKVPKIQLMSSVISIDTHNIRSYSNYPQ